MRDGVAAMVEDSGAERMAGHAALVPRATVAALAETPCGKKPSTLDVEEVGKAAGRSLDNFIVRRNAIVVGEPYADEVWDNPGFYRPRARDPPVEPGILGHSHLHRIGWWSRVDVHTA